MYLFLAGTPRQSAWAISNNVRVFGLGPFGISGLCRDLRAIAHESRLIYFTWQRQQMQFTTDWFIIGTYPTLSIYSTLSYVLQYSHSTLIVLPTINYYCIFHTKWSNIQSISLTYLVKMCCIYLMYSTRDLVPSSTFSKKRCGEKRTCQRWSHILPTISSTSMTLSSIIITYLTCLCLWYCFIISICIARLTMSKHIWLKTIHRRHDIA